MSRIGKKFIEIPKDITVTYVDKKINVNGPKGTIEHTLHENVDLDIQDQIIRVVLKDQSRKNKAFQGLTRSLINNMVIGVSKGFQRTLEINGIGYRAEINGNALKLTLGYSHPIDFKLPKGITAVVPKPNIINISGIDKGLVGQTCADIRAFRSPEPYKGKGIKYAEERIQRKAGKTGTK
jgi:large subunit ribosomal protein L6